MIGGAPRVGVPGYTALQMGNINQQAGQNAVAADLSAVDPYAQQATADNATISADQAALTAQQASQTAALSTAQSTPGAQGASSYPSYPNPYGLGSGSPTGPAQPSGGVPVTASAPWAVNPWSMQGDSNTRTP